MGDLGDLGVGDLGASDMLAVEKGEGMKMSSKKRHKRLFERKRKREVDVGKPPKKARVAKVFMSAKNCTLVDKSELILCCCLCCVVLPPMHA